MAFELRCNVCGKPARVVAASAYGATSYAFCDDCLEKGLEPYSAVVAYIACAGHFPEDINETYRARRAPYVAPVGKDRSRIHPRRGRDDPKIGGSGMNVILGVQPDVPIETNAMGGKQSATPYAFHMLPPNAVFAAAEAAKTGRGKVRGDAIEPQLQAYPRRGTHQSRRPAPVRLPCGRRERRSSQPCHPARHVRL